MGLQPALSRQILGRAKLIRFLRFIVKKIKIISNRHKMSALNSILEWATKCLLTKIKDD
jgi:hypothetical protein